MTYIYKYYNLAVVGGSNGLEEVFGSAEYGFRVYPSLSMADSTKRVKDLV